MINDEHIKKINEDTKKILENIGKGFKEIDEFSYEFLKTIIEEVIGNNDPYWNIPVYNIVKKIIQLPFGTTTTIANLINYDPNEQFIEPLLQGQIRNLVNNTCKKLNIELEVNKDSKGGLAYYQQFKKIDPNAEDKEIYFLQRQVNELLNDMEEKDNQILNNMERICKNYLNNNVDFVNKVAKYLPETFYYTDIDSLDNCVRIELNINNQNYFFAFNQNRYNIILKGEKNIKSKGALPENLYNEIYNKIVSETNNINNFIDEDGDIFYSIIIKSFNDNKILFGNSKPSVVKNTDNIKLYMMNILNKLIFGNDNKKEFNQKLFEAYQKRERADFSLELYSGVPGLLDETSIEIFSYNMNIPQVFNININGKNYNEQTYLFENIKSLVDNYLDKFILYSKYQNTEFLSEYATAGGGIIIHITYGNLNIRLIPTAHEDMCNVIFEFENRLKSLFLNTNIN